MAWWFGTSIFEYTYVGTKNSNGSPSVVPTFNTEFTDFSVSARDNGDGTITVEVVSTSNGYDIGYDYDTIYYDSLVLPSKISFQGLDTVTNIKFYGSMESGFNEDGLAYTIGGLTDMSNMFNGCSSLTSIEGLQYIDTSNVTIMDYMFNGCRSLTSLDVSNWDTSSVTNMKNMFSDCHNITSLDLTNWDTSNVTDFTWLFVRCYNLTSVGNISKCDTSNVTCFDSMFFECSSLSELDLSNWNTSNVTDMGYMFWGCQSLTSLDVSNWDNSKVTVMDYMFNGCQSLISLNVSNWDISNVANMSEMFHDCQLLNSIIMNNSDYNSVNTIIIQLPTRTIESLGSLNVTGIDDISQVNTTTAQAKYWNLVNEESEKTNSLRIGDTAINNIYLGDSQVLKIYLGTVLVYETSFE